MTKLKSAPVLVLAALCLLLLAACGAPAAPVATPEPTAEPTATPVPEISLFGETYRADIVNLPLQSRSFTPEDVRILSETLPRFPYLKQVDLADCELTPEQFTEVAAACPRADIVCGLELYGVHFSTADTLLDFSNVEMESTAEVEALIPYLHRLEKIDMSYTGFDDETMDAMNKRYENVRVVWTMDLCDYYHVRTDDVGFIGTFYYYGYLTEKSIQRFQYCEDMICMDLGHRVTFDDLSVLYKMPQLQYLLLADCFTVDYTPVGSLENLVYLEMIFGKHVTDLSPLKNLKNLKDLNVCFCYETDPEINFATFSQMPWLERLYYSNGMIPEGREDELAACLPDTQIQVIYAEGQATGKGWRYHKRYYEMRDLLGAWYMGDYGGEQTVMLIDGEEVPIPQEIKDRQKTAADIQGRH